MTDFASLVNPQAIAAARLLIGADVRHTPLLRLPGPLLGVGCPELWLKLEQLQIGGSFKARGMFNRMRSLPIPAAGVVIASGGNAGIAVAAAARALGVSCEVFLPKLASHAKRQAVADLGAQAGYWYRRSGQPVAKDTVEAEWERIVSALLV